MAAAAGTAHELRELVRELVRQERGAWVPLAAALHAVHAHEAWRELGAENFHTWLAEEDVGRNRGYLLVSVWDGFSHLADELTGLDPAKFTLLVGLVRRGELDPETALADVRTLSRSDLRQKYGTSHDHDDPGEVEACPTCGRTMPAA
jgi:hypothetical protein